MNTKILSNILHKISHSKKNIPIVFGCSNQYVPYLYTTLLSLKQHTSKEHFYEINILETNITDFAKKNIKELFSNTHNIDLKFINLTDIIDKNIEYFLPFKEKNKLPSNAGLVTFYSIFIPEIFSSYEKVIFLDADLIIEEDIANLFSIDMEDKAFAGVLDLQMINAVQSNVFNKEYSIREYFNNILKLDCFNYINTGVFLVNVSKLKERNFFQKALDFIKNTVILYPDQDVYNKILNDSIKIISPEWNYQEIFENHNFIHKLNNQEIKQDLLNIKKPKIFHYASKRFLHDLQSESELRFWKYAKETPYYEALLNMRIISVQLNK